MKRTYVWIVIWALFVIGLCGLSEAANIQDDFNDTALNESLWTNSDLYYDGTALTGNGGSAGVINGYLETTTEGGSRFSQGGIKSLFQLTGDFDIQIDFNLVTFNQYWSDAALLVSSPDGKDRMNIYVSVSNDNNKHYESVYYINNVLYTPQGYYIPELNDASLNTLTSGKLRLTRSGSTITSYYWTGSGWVSLVSATVFDGPAIVYLIASNDGNAGSAPSVNVQWDNFNASASAVSGQTGLVSQWTAEGNANDVVDGNHGTLKLSANAVNGEGGVTFAPGKVGQGFKFDGTGLVYVPDAPNLQITGPVTVEAWVSWAGGIMPDPPPIAAKWVPDSSGYGIFVANNGTPIFIVSNVSIGGQRVQVDAPTTIPLNTFAHVVGVWTGTEAQLYVNGVLQATAPFEGPLPDLSGVPITMGAYDSIYHGGNTASMIGVVDEVKIYARALSATEIQDIFNSFDTTAPTISSTSPANGATDVAVNSTITATFSEAMDDSTINTTTFTVNDGNNNIGGTVSYSGTTATFTPSANLSYSTTYTATITTGVKDLAGNAMSSNYTWSFTTGVSAITLTGLVEFSTDSTGAGHPNGANVWNTLGGDQIRNLYVTQGSSLVGEFINTGNGASTSIEITLSPGTYTFMLWAESATWTQADYHGLNLFFNGNNTNPKISVFAPTDMDLPTPPGPAFSANTSAITWDLARTWYAPVPGAGTLSFVYGTTTVTLTDYFLSFPDVFSTDRIQGYDSSAGEDFDFVGSFTLQVSGTPMSPTVSSTSPANGTTDVAVNSAITATFSETMDASTITTATFTVSDGSSNIGGTVSYSGTTATFTPSANLSYSTTYTATITTGVTDTEGNAMAFPYTWNFTTETGSSNIEVTFDTTDQTGQHLEGGFVWGTGAQPVDANGYVATPAISTVANGGRRVIGAIWKNLSNEFSLAINKDTTYWLDVLAATVTSESTPGVNKVNFVFEPIDVVFDTTDQTGQHLEGGFVWGTGAQPVDANGYVATPAISTVANGGRRVIGAIWKNLSNEFSLVINKDTTYWLDVLAATVTSESTPGVNKVNFVFVATNTAPVANAGADQSVFVNDTVTLDGSGSTDVDGNLLTYTWAFTTRPDGSTATLSNTAAVNPTFTVDKADTYVISLIVNDGTVNSTADTVTISTLNSAPVSNAGPDQSVYVNNTVTLDGSGSMDVDGNLLTYTWAFTTRPDGSTAALSNTAAVNPTFTVDKAGTYVVSLIVNDGTVNSTADTVTISTLNSAPVSNAGPDQSVYVGNTVTLDGSGSTDVDGNLLTYSWAFTTIPTGSMATLANPTSVNPTFVVDKAGTYVVSLIVNDGTVNSTADTVTISTLNSAPVSNAGPDQSVYVNNTVTLDGSGSTDVDGNLLTYIWAFTTIPTGSTATLANPTLVNPAFTVDKAGTYVVSLIVNDGTVNSIADTVTISTLNSAPVANAGADQLITLIGTTLQLDGTQSYDLDGDTITYQWSFVTKPDSSSTSLVNADTATPTFTADVRGDYVLQLIVKDSTTQSSPDTVTISFENIKPVADAGMSRTVNVGETVTLDGSGSMDANGDALTYNWTLTSVPSGNSSNIADSTAMTTTFVPDVAGTYVAQLVVNDGTVDSDPVTIQIQATTSRETVVDIIRDIEDQISLLDPSVFKNANMQKTFINKLNAVIANIEAGNYADALDQLQNDILGKMDGCATSGAPDKNDWIKDCASQNIIYPLVQDTITALQDLV